jgi:hypothetical protein
MRCETRCGTRCGTRGETRAGGGNRVLACYGGSDPERARAMSIRGQRQQASSGARPTSPPSACARAAGHVPEMRQLCPPCAPPVKEALHERAQWGWPRALREGKTCLNRELHNRQPMTTTDNRCPLCLVPACAMLQVCQTGSVGLTHRQREEKSAWRACLWQCACAAMVDSLGSYLRGSCNAGGHRVESSTHPGPPPASLQLEAGYSRDMRFRPP